MLELTYLSIGSFTLADGSESVSRLYIAEVFWMDRWQRISVAEMEGDPLAGMMLMRGCHLAADVIEGGAVTITKLQ